MSKQNTHSMSSWGASVTASAATSGVGGSGGAANGEVSSSIGLLCSAWTVLFDEVKKLIMISLLEPCSPRKREPNLSMRHEIFTSERVGSRRKGAIFDSITLNEQLKLEVGGRAVELSSDSNLAMR